MKIGNGKYKGFTYEILFTGDGDWGKHKNLFYFECSSFPTDYYATYKQCVQAVEQAIDMFVDNIPKTAKELVSKLSELLVWTGYESCHLDEDAALILVESFIKKI